MEIFLIICVLALITWYSVRIYLSHKKKKSRGVVRELLFSKDIFLTWLDNLIVSVTGLQRLIQDLSSSFYGSKQHIYTILIALLSQWHALIQGAPWTWKTSLVRAFSQACDLSYWRIQCTPDLLPQDILWVETYKQQEESFAYNKGPIFSHVVHVDEINRATPKLQSAFLEAMQERQVTLSGKTYPLPDPFFLIATQNPYDAIWTFLLPYAQVDRFMMWVVVGDISTDETLQLVKDAKQVHTGSDKYDHIQACLSVAGVLAMQQEIQSIHAPESVLQYCVACVQYIKDAWFQMSIRATTSLVAAAKTIAYMQWKKETTIDDIALALLPVVKHRMAYIVWVQLSDEKIYAILTWSLQKDDIVG